MRPVARSRFGWRADGHVAGLKKRGEVSEEFLIAGRGRSSRPGKRRSGWELRQLTLESIQRVEIVLKEIEVGFEVTRLRR